MVVVVPITPLFFLAPFCAHLLSPFPYTHTNAHARACTKRSERHLNFCASFQAYDWRSFSCNVFFVRVGKTRRRRWTRVLLRRGKTGGKETGQTQDYGEGETARVALALMEPSLHASRR